MRIMALNRQREFVFKKRMGCLTCVLFKPLEAMLA